MSVSYTYSLECKIAQLKEVLEKIDEYDNTFLPLFNKWAKLEILKDDK